AAAVRPVTRAEHTPADDRPLAATALAPTAPASPVEPRQALDVGGAHEAPRADTLHLPSPSPPPSMPDAPAVAPPLARSSAAPDRREAARPPRSGDNEPQPAARPSDDAPAHPTPPATRAQLN